MINRLLVSVFFTTSHLLVQVAVSTMKCSYERITTRRLYFGTRETDTHCAYVLHAHAVIAHVHLLAVDTQYAFDVVLEQENKTYLCFSFRTVKRM